MNMKEYQPSARLRPYIKAYRIIESDTHATNRVLPNTSVAMAFRLYGQVSYVNDNNQVPLPAATVSGLRKSVRLIHYQPQSAVLVVMFNETGMPAFFKQPLHELFEYSISLDNFLPPSEIALVGERLAEAANNNDKIKIIETFLFSKLTHSRTDELIKAAVEKIYASTGQIKISALANSLYISQDALEKRFRKITGTSPKQFAFITKLNAIIARNHGYTGSFIDLALNNGYFDQAHFNKDFKLFTGQVPGSFFRSALYW